MSKGALYTRLSPRPDGDYDGVDRQIEDCLKLLARQGITDPLIFSDPGLSAWRPKVKRPGWDALVAAIDAGKIDTLAVWHPDRLLRLPRDLERLLDASEKHGIHLLSVGGSRDLSNPDDRFILRVEVAHACRSSDDASRRLRRKFAAMAAEGKAHGGARPFGLSEDRRSLHPQEADAVREAARRLLAGESLRSVTAWLNTTGLAPTGKAASWSAPTVRQMLKRPSIAGLRQHQGEIVGSAQHPATLDEDTYTAVFALLTDPSRRRAHSTARRHLLSGLLLCAHCDNPMRRAVAHGHARYWCSHCYRIAIAQDSTDLFVTEAVKERVRMAGLRPRRSSQPSEDGIGARIIALRARLNQIAEEFAHDLTITPTQIRTMTTRIQEELRQLEAVQSERLAHRVVMSVTPDVADSFDALSLDNQRSVIRAVADKIVIVPGRRGARFDPDRIQITWREFGV